MKIIWWALLDFHTVSLPLLKNLPYDEYSARRSPCFLANFRQIMKALVKHKSAPGLRMEDVPMPEIGINDVLIKVDRTGICGTDLHIYNWDAWAQSAVPAPLVIGHEFVGEIVEVGSNVSDFSAGNIVSGEGHVVCGRCRNCMAGRRHLCADTKGIGVNRPGAFAEYIALPMANVWHHDDDIDRDLASIFDPFGNAVHTALTFDLLGEDVLITGAGPIGCMAAAVCQYAGARYVIVTDVNPWRLDLAKKMGATRVVDVRNETLEEVQKELGMREGLRRWVGDVRQSLPLSATCSLTCVTEGKSRCSAFRPKKLRSIGILFVFNMLTISGIYGRRMYETWYKMTVMLQGGLDISPVITHHFAAEDFEKGFEVMNSGESGKVILQW
jgi:threonine 3-dehydrogenase